jgi:hypothetical protein
MPAPNRWQQIVTTLYGQRFGYNYLKQLVSEGKIVAQFNTDAAGNNTSIGVGGPAGALGLTFPLVDRSMVAITGDSLEARHNVNVDTSGFTAAAANGVATISQTGHAVPPGTVIHMGGWSDPLWNGWFTVRVSGMTANAFTFAIDPAASASPSAGDYTPNYVAPSMRMYNGAMNWSEWLTGLDFNYKNIAIGSRKLAQIASEFLEDIAVVGVPGTLIIGGGTNDCNQAVATATSSAALESLIQQAQGLGIQVIVWATPPFAAPATTTAKANAVLALNTEKRRLCRLYDCVYWDRYELLADPASSGLLLSGMFDSSDGIHLTPLADKLTAETFAIPYFIGNGAGKAIPLISCTGDLVGTLTSANNIHPVMTGTGGTESGGATGDTITGWTLANSSLTSVTASVAAANVNSKQVVDVVSSGSGSYTYTGPAIQTSMTAGRKYVFMLRVNVNMPTAFRHTVELRLTISSSNGSLRAAASIGSTLPNAPGNYTMTLQTDPDGWTFPTDATLTSAQVLATCVPGAGTGRIEYEEVTVREILS